MPKHVDDHGQPVKFHPTVIRFTDNQKVRLETLKITLNISLNNLVRKMIDSQLSIYEEVQNASDVSE